MSLSDALLARLDVLVIERTPAGYRALGDAPGWARPMVDADRRVDLPDDWYVLRDFAEQSAEAWPDDAVSSGPWHQDTPTGTLDLEARALRLRGRELLLVERLGPRFEAHRRALQLARERALDRERLDRELVNRDVLTHSIVHDLRSPLTSIKGTLDLIRSGMLKPEQQGPLVEAALRGIAHQQGLIDDIMDVFGTEAGALEQWSDDDGRTTCLAEACREVASQQQAAARTKQLALECDVPADARAPVIAEPRRLQRVLGNLVSNALRHSPPGGAVQIRLRSDGTEPTVEVEDDGEGVDEQVADRLFERFARGRGGNSGLGLYFCRITVERWGGRIGYRPGTGGGSCFWFTLRAPATAD